MTLRKWMAPALLFFLFASFVEANPPAEETTYEYITLGFTIGSNGNLNYRNVQIDLDKEKAKAYHQELKALKSYPKVLNLMGSRGWQLKHTYTAPTSNEFGIVIYVFQKKKE